MSAELLSQLNVLWLPLAQQDRQVVHSYEDAGMNAGLCVSEGSLPSP